MPVDAFARTLAGGVRGLIVPPTHAPAKPLDVLALAGNASATVQWVHPTPEHVTSYLITASTGQTVQVAANGIPRQKATISGLTNGVAVTLTVTAINGAGSGYASSASNTVTPSSLPSTVLPVTNGLEYWFSATQLAATNGAAVSSLPDYSGNGYNAAQEASGATFVSSWSTGHPAIDFPGTGARFNTSASGLTPGMRAPQQTIYMLFSTTGAPNPGAVVADRILSAETPFTSVSAGYALGFAVTTGMASGTGTLSILDGTSALTGSGTEYASGSTATATPFTLALQRPGNAWVNGTPLNINLAPTFDVRPISKRNLQYGTMGITTAEAFGYGFGAQIGGRFNQSWNGRLAEVLIYTGTHTTAELNAVQAYLNGLK